MAPCACKDVSSPPPQQASGPSPERAPVQGLRACRVLAAGVLRHLTRLQDLGSVSPGL